MSKELKTSANTGAKEKGIEERTYDLRSKFSDDEYGFLLSRVFDKFEDLDNELYLKVISNRRILSDDIEQLQSIIRDYLKVTSINDRYLMGTAILQKLFDLLCSEPSKVTEAEPQEQSDVTDTEPQEQEREVKKTSANNTGAEEKGIEERTYYYADLRSELSDDELDFLVGFILCKFEDTHNEFYLKYIRDSEFSSSDIDQLLSLILDYLKVTPYKPGTISGNRYDMAKAIYHKLSEIVEEPQEQSYVTDTEPQEQEREEPNTEDFLINYLVTVYYVDGHSSFRIFSGCADGIVFNFQQNSLHLDDLENGNRSVFNMFNFPDPEDIVACDVSFTLIPYLPF